MVLTATIDKLEHLRKYTVWHYHPYHYCQAVLLERFAMWMNRRGYKGDVYGESRGRNEDADLKRAFRQIYRNGAQLSAQQIQRSVTSGDIKLRRKAENIAGLQLADLVAHPSFKAMLARKANLELPADFGGQVAEILEGTKYDRSARGEIEGYGRKWLP